MPMIRVLITGMSGTGKSSVVRELRRRGFHAIDTDEDGWSYRDESGNQLWHDARVMQEFEAAGEEPLFLSGCSESQVAFYPLLSSIVLLSMPRTLLIERLRTRTSNSYGKSSAELDEVLFHLETVEPLLRARANLEIQTTKPVDEVVDQILAYSSIRRH